MFFLIRNRCQSVVTRTNVRWIKKEIETRFATEICRNLSNCKGTNRSFRCCLRNHHLNHFFSSYSIVKYLVRDRRFEKNPPPLKASIESTRFLSDQTSSHTHGRTHMSNHKIKTYFVHFIAITQLHRTREKPPRSIFPLSKKRCEKFVVFSIHWIHLLEKSVYSSLLLTLKIHILWTK